MPAQTQPTARALHAWSAAANHTDFVQRWSDDDWQGQPVKPLSPSEARVLMQREPSVSPWWIVLVQVVVGIVVALLAWAVMGRVEGFWSALYGATVVVVPAMLMARGMTSKLGSLAPVVGAASFMVWQGVKVAASMSMLMLATRIVPDLSWPALLVSLVVCIKVYWLALLWRRVGKSKQAS